MDIWVVGPGSRSVRTDGFHPFECLRRSLIGCRDFRFLFLVKSWVFKGGQGGCPLIPSSLSFLFLSIP